MDIKCQINHISAIAPSTLVITFCPNAPTAMANTPWIRLRCGKKSTRPPYSPIRLGVNMAHVNPQNTASIDCHSDRFARRWARNRHFAASNTQLTSISRNTSAMMYHAQEWLMPPTSFSNCSRSALLFSRREIKTKASRRMAALMR